MISLGMVALVGNLLGAVTPSLNCEWQALEGTPAVSACLLRAPESDTGDGLLLLSKLLSNGSMGIYMAPAGRYALSDGSVYIVSAPNRGDLYGWQWIKQRAGHSHLADGRPVEFYFYDLLGYGCNVYELKAPLAHYNWLGTYPTEHGLDHTPLADGQYTLADGTRFDVKGGETGGCYLDGRYQNSAQIGVE